MSTVTFTFRIPEEQVEMLWAAKAGEMFSTIRSFDEFLRKYGDAHRLTDNEVQLLDTMRRIWSDETEDIRDLLT